MKPGLVAATLLLLTAGLALAADPVTENWKDDEGDNMVLEVQPDSFTGIYDGGRVTGTLQKDGSYAGFWMEEDTSDTECADKRDGTPYWGRLIFKFDAKRQHFHGIYSDCDDKPDPSNIWNGDRLDDAAARQAPSSNADAASAPPTSSSSEVPPSAGAISIASISSEAPVGVEMSASVAAPASNDAASSGATPSQAPGPFKRHHH